MKRKKKYYVYADWYNYDVTLDKSYSLHDAYVAAFRYFDTWKAAKKYALKQAEEMKKSKLKILNNQIKRIKQRQEPHDEP